MDSIWIPIIITILLNAFRLIMQWIAGVNIDLRHLPIHFSSFGIAVTIGISYHILLTTAAIDLVFILFLTTLIFALLSMILMRISKEFIEKKSLEDDLHNKVSFRISVQIKGHTLLSLSGMFSVLASLMPIFFLMNLCEK